MSEVGVLMFSLVFFFVHLLRARPSAGKVYKPEGRATTAAGSRLSDIPFRNGTARHSGMEIRSKTRPSTR